ncbi:MAG: hypothetical protein WC773_01820 [Patescibacteria group bacterium]|jgi:capsular polysaccharide biosynthesis protein
MLDIVNPSQINQLNSRVNQVSLSASISLIITSAILTLVFVGGTAFYVYGNKYPGNASEIINSRNKNNTDAGANLTNSNYLVPPGPQ